MNIYTVILDEVQARLNNIATTKEYDFTVESGSIKRASLTPFKPVDLPAINYYPAEDSLSSKAGGVENRTLTLLIECYTKEADRPFTDAALELSTNVLTALARSTTAPLVSDTSSPSLGGLIHGMTVEKVTPFIGEGQLPWCGVIITLNIDYRISIGNFSTLK